MLTLIVDEELRHGVEFEVPIQPFRAAGLGKGGDHGRDRCEEERGIRMIALKATVATRET